MTVTTTDNLAQISIIPPPQKAKDEVAPTKKFCFGMIEGQYTPHKDKPRPSDAVLATKRFPVLWEKFVYNRPNWFGSLLPLVFHLIWWTAYMAYTNKWYLFEKNYFATITMFFGSIVAGGTSEGGGSIAYPVFTLGFNIPSAVARDFSLMIQSVGMTSASFTIFYLQIEMERNSLVWVNLGGAIGVFSGLLWIAPLIPDDITKMLFVSIWFTFAASLFILNMTNKDRIVFEQIPRFNNTKRNILFITGIVGGIFTSLAGSGIDICSFAILTLLFRVSEKVATPTSVVLMGTNTVIGFLTKLIFLGIEEEAWDYWLCAAPIVPFGAPMGAMLSSFLHRLVYAACVYITDSVQFVAAFIIVPQDKYTIATAISSLLIGGFVFFLISNRGRKYLEEAVESGEHLKNKYHKHAAASPVPEESELIVSSTRTGVDETSAAKYPSGDERGSDSDLEVNESVPALVAIV